MTNAKNARNLTHPIRETLWARLGLTYNLYDDAFAFHISQFLRGRDEFVLIARPAFSKRKRCYCARACR